MSKLSSQNPNYFTDLPYTAGYFEAMSTFRARVVLALSGFEITELSTACELGYGRGVSIALHSASSEVEWYGTDMLPDHVKFAK